MDVFLARGSHVSKESDVLRSIELPPSPEPSQPPARQTSEPAAFEINWARLPTNLSYSRPTKRAKTSWIWEHGADLVDPEERRFWLCRRCMSCTVHLIGFYSKILQATSQSPCSTICSAPIRLPISIRTSRSITHLRKMA